MDTETPIDCKSTMLAGGHAVSFESPAPYRGADEVSEDRLSIVELDPDNFLLVVADGVGGMPEGEVASAAIIDALGKVTGKQPASDVSAAVVAAIEQSHDALLVTGRGCASTVSVAHVFGNSFRSVHVGDSIVMTCSQRGRLKYETIAHSPVGYALESGLITEEDAFHHAERHLVSNLVGTDSLHIAVSGITEMAPRDTLLVASDGLTDNLRQAEIIDLIRKGDLLDCGRELAELARNRMARGGKPDDLSFILYRRGHGGAEGRNGPH